MGTTVNGYPTKKRLQGIIDLYFQDTHIKPRISISYRTNGIIVFDKKKLNDLIPDFIKHLETKNIQVAKWIPYECPSNGIIRIRKNENKI